jgi:DNA-binding response OmpR family regulator
MADLLLVEDEPNVALSLTFLMRQEGHALRHVATLAEARAALQEQPPDLLLLDAMLPDGNGVDLCREIRRHPDLSGVRILLVSARGREADRAAAAAAGADGYVTKPFAIRDVIAEVAALLHP